MEASDTTQVETTDEAQQDTQTQDSGQQPDLTQFEQMLDSRFSDLRDEIPSLIGGFQQQPEEVAQDNDALDDFASLFAQDYGQEVGPQAQNLDPQQLQDAFKAVVQQTVGPQLQAIQEKFLDQEADALEQKYPALQDPKTQREVVAQAVQVAQAFGNPDLARQPSFIELVFKSQMADQRAAQETPAGGNGGVELETGGGAAPQVQQPTSDDDIRQGIVGAGGGNLFGG